MMLRALFIIAIGMSMATNGVEAKGVRGIRRKLQLQLVGYGSEPNRDRFPLGLCEGDCDK